MPYGRWQATIVNDAGNIQPVATIDVFREIDGARPALKANRAGSIGKDNPFQADSAGFAFFHAPGVAGGYRIVATLGSFSREWRNVPLGTATEVDIDSLSGDVIIEGSPTGIRQVFATATGAADPGNAKWRANHATFASITALYIDNVQTDAESITAWLDALDDGGTSAHRGVLRFENVDEPLEWATFNVTDSVVDSTGYRTLTVTPRGQAGWPFAADAVTAMTFVPTGGQGTQGIQGIQGIQGDPGEGLGYDAIAADLTERDATTTPVGVRVAVSDIGDGRSAIYELLDDSPQTWSDPLYISGVGGGGAGSGLLKCRTVALSNVNISNALENGDTLNGITLATDDVVLLVAQTDDEDNGPYVVSSSGAASRHPDYDDYDAVAGSYFAVLEGTQRADTLWLCTSDPGGTIDTDPLEFEQFMGNEDDYGLITGAVSGGEDYGSVA